MGRYSTKLIMFITNTSPWTLLEDPHIYQLKRSWITGIVQHHTKPTGWYLLHLLLYFSLAPKTRTVSLCWKTWWCREPQLPDNYCYQNPFVCQSNGKFETPTSVGERLRFGKLNNSKRNLFLYQKSTRAKARFSRVYLQLLDDSQG